MSVGQSIMQRDYVKDAMRKHLNIRNLISVVEPDHIERHRKENTM